MPKRRRKQINCLNCETPLKEPFNFCPNCGQENNDNNISFGALYKDFWSNYFSIDSRFGRTLRPFFTKPGAITLDFISGKRVKFANPVRLYLLISFVHFFFFFKYSADRENVPSIISFNTGNDSLSVATVDSLVALPDSLQGSNEIISSRQLSTMIRLNKENKYTVDQVYDSLGVSESDSWVQQRTIRQLIKINRMKNNEVNLYVYRQIPIGMFFILPIVALLMKLMHRKRLYILHVVHALHLHSFALLILGFSWCVMWLIHSENELIIISSMLLGVVYSVISFKRVYQHGWGKTVLKFFITGFLYQFTLVLFVVLLALTSLFLY
jgi:hypothetical protein